MTDLEKIDLEIEKQEEVVKRAEKLTENKMHFGQGPWKELARLKIERELMLTDVTWEYASQGVVLIEGKYFFSLISGKWRVKGKTTWYRSKGVRSFIDNYVRETPALEIANG
jgi:hypothetical protein